MFGRCFVSSLLMYHSQLISQFSIESRLEPQDVIRSRLHHLTLSVPVFDRAHKSLSGTDSIDLVARDKALSVQSPCNSLAIGRNLVFVSNQGSEVFNQPMTQQVNSITLC